MTTNVTYQHVTYQEDAGNHGTDLPEAGRSHSGESRTITPLLSARHLTRTFDKGRFTAVEDVSFDIRPGEVFALVGPNGAGKTTTVRMCATLLTPSSGSLVIGGVDAVRHPLDARAGIGLALGGDLGFYPRASALDNLLFFADVAGVPGPRRRTEVADALERVGLTDRATSKVGEFSRGMKQRLHIARALLGGPGLLLLDEPTGGLDPEASLDVRDLIASLAGEGVGVLLTSHSMDEVEELATVIAVIGAGRIVVRGQVRDIARYAGVGETTTATLPARAAGIRDDLIGAVGESGDALIRPKGAGWSLTVHWREDGPRTGPENATGTTDTAGAGVARLLDVLRNAGFDRPADLLTRPANLEDAYLAISDGLRR